MLTSHELFGFMSPALANDILNFTFESDKPTYKATLAAVAKAIHVRPVYLERQPRAQRHATMISTLSKPGLDAVAGAFIRAWLVKKHKAMLVDFLERARHSKQRWRRGRFARDRGRREIKIRH